MIIYMPERRGGERLFDSRASGRTNRENYRPIDERWHSRPEGVLTFSYKSAHLPKTEHEDV